MIPAFIHQKGGEPFKLVDATYAFADMELREEQMSWLAVQCDASLIVEGRCLPVHKLCLVSWSRVLGDCVLSTLDSKPASSSSKLLHIPVEGPATAIEALLQLLVAKVTPQSF